MSLKKSVLANFIGRGWVAVMGLAFVPVYIDILGAEAYGLISFFVVIQSIMYLLDMGITPTISREMARFTADKTLLSSIHDLFLSLQIIVMSIAIGASIVLWFNVGYVAKHWLNVSDLPILLVEDSLKIMSLVVCLRFGESIYQGALIGMQRQVELSFVNATFATFRYAGVVGVLLLYTADIKTFFLWQMIVSIVSLVSVLVLSYSFLPRPVRLPKFSREALSEIQGFIAGMFGITLLSFLLVQADKLILSKMLPLDAFGYYMLAAAIAGSIGQVVAPSVQAIYPRLVEMVAQENEDHIRILYHRAAQLVTITIAPLVIVTVLFAEEILYIWSQNISLAASVAPILIVAMIGGFLNGMMHVPYSLQLAHGWTGLTLRVNFLSIFFTIPALLFLVPIYGALAAAYVWATVNFFSLLITIHFLHNRFLKADKWKWYALDVFMPTFPALAFALIAYGFKPLETSNSLIWVVFITLTFLTCSAIALMTAGYWRRWAIEQYKLYASRDNL